MPDPTNDVSPTLEAYYQGLQGSAGAEPPPDLLTLPPPDVCWSCREPVGPAEYCAGCGAPVGTESADRLRYLVCICHEIKKHERAGRIDLSAAHGGQAMGTEIAGHAFQAMGPTLDRRQITDLDGHAKLLDAAATFRQPECQDRNPLRRTEIARPVAKDLEVEQRHLLPIRRNDRIVIH